jgi:hypothetical protein
MGKPIYKYFFQLNYFFHLKTHLWVWMGVFWAEVFPHFANCGNNFGLFFQHERIDGQALELSDQFNAARHVWALVVQCHLQSNVNIYEFLFNFKPTDLKNTKRTTRVNLIFVGRI